MRAVLISPPTIDAKPVPGPVSSRPSFVDEAAGFRAQLKSADSALMEEPHSVPARALLRAVPAADKGPVRPTPSQYSKPAAQQNIFVAPATRPKQDATNEKAAPPVADTAMPHTRESHLSTPPEKGKTQQENDVPGQVIKAPAAATQNAPVEAPLQAAGAPSPPVAPANTDIHKVAQAISEYAGDQTDAMLADEPLPVQAPPVTFEPASVTKGAGEGSFDDLAFAMKVQPAKVPSMSPHAATSDTPDGAPATGNGTAIDPESSSSPVHPAKQGAESGGDQSGSGIADSTDKAADKDKATGEEPKQAFGMPEGHLSVQTDSQTHEVERSSASAPGHSVSQVPGAEATPAEAKTLPAAPMKEISMRVEGGDGQKVDVRIVQRAGDLQIAVKSADSDTTQGLRHGLSDLSNRLNESGYRSETWHPGQQVMQAEKGASTGDSPENSSHQSPSDGSQSHSGSSGSTGTSVTTTNLTGLAGPRNLNPI